MDRRATPPKRVTSPISGTPPPCKQALRITLTANGKHEFVPRDEVFPLIVVYCILLQFLLKTTSCFTPVVCIRIVLDSFHLLIFYSKKFST